MIKRLLFLLIIVTGLIFSFQSSIGSKKKTFQDNNDYYKINWAKVDSLDKKGLPQSALKIISQISIRAKKNKNSQQYIKALIFRMKFINSVEEDILQKQIFSLKKEANNLHFPVSSIEYSLLGEMYMTYYYSNRWKLADNEITTDSLPEDLAMWSESDFIDQAGKAYLLSIKLADNLKEIPIDKFRNIIIQGENSEDLRPTLYDFLAHRALDFFSGQAENIILQTPLLFPNNLWAPVGEFASINNKKLSEEKSINSSLKIYRELTKFRLKQENKKALLDLDFKRIKYIRDISYSRNKDSLYLSALKRFRNFYDHPECYFRIAEYYYDESHMPYVKNIKGFELNNYRVMARNILRDVLSDCTDSFILQKSEALIERIEKSYLSFENEENIIPGLSFPVKIKYKNLKNSHIRVLKPDTELIKGFKRDYNDEILKEIIEKSTIIQECNFVLPDPADYFEHSVEVVLDPLKSGEYFILMCSDKDFDIGKNLISYQFINATNLAYYYRQTYDGSLEFNVVDRNNGKPKPGVKASISYINYGQRSKTEEYKSGEKYFSDENGCFVIEAAKTSRRQTFKITLSKNNDYIAINRNFSVYNRKPVSTAVKRTKIFTDRKIYRPGQIVYYKTISYSTLNSKSKLLIDFPLQLIFNDANNQKIGSSDLITNEFGSATGTFPIPYGLLSGNYRISTGSGFVSIKVEEYKRPRFELNIDPLNKMYLLDQKVKVNGSAKSFSGSAITGVSANYIVRRQESYYPGKNFPFRNDRIIISSGYAQLDNSGSFSFEFFAIGDNYIPESMNKEYTFIVDVNITDLTGETRSISRNIRIGSRSHLIIADFPEKIERNSTKTFMLTSLNLNGDFVPVKGIIRIYKPEKEERFYLERKWQTPDLSIYSKDEWSKIFPEFRFPEKKKNSHNSGELVYEYKFDTSIDKELIIKSLKNWKEGRYNIEILTSSKAGSENQEQQFFDLYDEKKKRMPFEAAIWIANDKTTAQPGEKIRFMIGSSLKNVPVLYEIELGNRIIYKQMIIVSEEKKLLQIPVVEKYIGNFAVHFSLVNNNRDYRYSTTIHVPYLNKKLNIKVKNFRDVLLPDQKTELFLNITDNNGNNTAAEYLTTLYDASLDNIFTNKWNFNIYNQSYMSASLNTTGFISLGSNSLPIRGQKFISDPIRTYHQLNWFGFPFRSRRYLTTDAIPSGRGVVYKGDVVNTENNILIDQEIGIQTGDPENQPPNPMQDVQIVYPSMRSNFQETAFFFPDLRTDRNGNLSFVFTIPESLTKWKMLGIAHTQDLKIGLFEDFIQTRKDLMLFANPPRFVRVDDKIAFPVKIINSSGTKLDVTARLELYDAENMVEMDWFEPLDKKLIIDSAGVVSCDWELNIPENINSIYYKVFASSDNYSDGESSIIPVLPNKILITETLPLAIKANESKEYYFNTLLDSKDNMDIRKNKLVLEFTSNPTWYALQALPYMSYSNSVCTEKVFTRYYSNVLGQYIIQQNPSIKKVFDRWSVEKNENVFLSNLEKNMELKNILLEESPWVLETNNETDNKRKLALFFNVNNNRNNAESAIKKLRNSQLPDGSWPWFPGMRGSNFITRNILSGFGKLKDIGIKSPDGGEMNYPMIRKAVEYIDRELSRVYIKLKDQNPTTEDMLKNHLTPDIINHIYARSFYSEIKFSEKNREAFDYYFNLSEKYFSEFSNYLKALIALSYQKFGKSELPILIINSLKEYAIYDEEIGMYWKPSLSGFFWHNSPVVTQAAIIELFNKAGNDLDAVESQKLWLLKNKQTNSWNGSIATSNAVYALIMNGVNWLIETPDVKIHLGNSPIDIEGLVGNQPEPGSGYIKRVWKSSEIKPEMGNIRIERQGSGVSWGAMYYNYFNKLDNLTAPANQLRLNKSILVEKQADDGKVIFTEVSETKVHIGDKLRISLIVKTDRDMEFVHIQDFRAAGFEPIDQISGHKYRRGISYYQSNKDSNMNFFISFLPKGTHIFEYEVRAAQLGDFTNGISKIQCMYAPEFSAHTSGGRIIIEN